MCLPEKRPFVGFVLLATHFMCPQFSFSNQKMYRPNGQQCLTNAIIDQTCLRWFNANAYINEAALLVPQTRTRRKNMKNDYFYNVTSNS